MIAETQLASLNIDWHSFIAQMRDTAFVLIVYIYFIGWLFARTFYGKLGIPVKDIDLNYAGHLIYSIRILETFWSLIAVVVFIILSAIAVVLVNTYYPKTLEPFLIALGVVALPILIFISYNSAISLAQSYMKNPERHTDCILIKISWSENFKPDKENNALTNLNEQDKLYFFCNGKDFIYVIANLHDSPNIFAIKKELISTYYSKLHS